MPSPRLLVVTKHLLDPRDAQAQQSAALIAALAENFRVEVITGAAAPGITPINFEHDLQLHALPARWLTHHQTLPAKISRKLDRNLSAWLPTRWAIDAGRLASELVAANRYDAIISIALPMESHIAVQRAKRGAPWVACMSDPWPESLLPPPYSDFALPVLNALQRKTVARSFIEADALVFSCAESLRFLARHYPELEESKAFVVPHVAPGTLRRLSAPEAACNEIDLVHGGALSRERVCPGLAEALAKLPPSSRWRLRFIGQVHPDMLELLERASAMHRVSVDGWKTKSETLAALASAHALLLVEAAMPDYPFLPSKLADYTATGRPIIAITGEQSATARLVRKYNAGFVSGHDANSILRALVAMEAAHDRLSSNVLGKIFDAGSVAKVFQEIIASLNTRTIS